MKPERWHLLVVASFFVAGFLVHYFAAGYTKSPVQAPVEVRAPSMEEIANKSLVFISENYLEPRGIEGKLSGVEAYGDDLYAINLSLKLGDAERQTTLFATKDGKLILLGTGGTVVDVMREAVPTQVEAQREELPEEKVVSVGVDDDPTLGSSEAKVTIIEFSDFQCSFCQRFWSETLPLIKESYVNTGQARLVYRDFPIDSIHPFARKAAEAAECADEQGKFWEYHDVLFANFDSWQQPGTEAFKAMAKNLGLDESKFGACVDSGKYAQEVQKDLQDGSKAGITGTPTFFVNGVKIEGAQPFSAFQEAIEAQLK